MPVPAHGLHGINGPAIPYDMLSILNPDPSQHGHLCGVLAGLSGAGSLKLIGEHGMIV